MPVAPASVFISSTTYDAELLSTNFSLSWDGYDSNVCYYTANFTVYAWVWASGVWSSTLVRRCEVPLQNVTLLRCSLGPSDGFGAGQGLFISVVPRNTSPSRPPDPISYPPPQITSVVANNASGEITITGSNFGNSSSTLDWLRYTAQSVFTTCTATGSGECGTALPTPTGCGGANPSSCRLFLARSCRVVVPHVNISCMLHPESYGAGPFWLQVSIGSQASQWFNTTQELHASPRIDSITVARPAGQIRDLTFNTAQTSGGSLVTISGAGLSLNTSENELHVEIGFIAVPASHVGGNLIVTAPRGFGVVDVIVRVGSKNSTGRLTYQDIGQIGLEAVYLTGSSANDSPKTFLLLGEGLSSCALAFCYNSELGGCSSDTYSVALETCARPSPSPTNCADMWIDGDPRRVSMAPAYCFDEKNNSARGCMQDRSTEPKRRVTSTMGSEDSGLCVKTASRSGNLTLLFGGIAASFSYTFSELETLRPRIIRASEPPLEKLDAGGGSLFSFEAEESGLGGEVTLSWADDSSGAYVRSSPSSTRATLRTLQLN